MTDTTVFLKSLTAHTATVAGYGVIFGGVDLDGESFGPDTDYMLDLVPEKPVLYDHGARTIDSFIGKVKASAIKRDDKGLWIEAELDRHADYMDAVLALMEKGALGWSSGTVGHLARRDGKSIKTWPIIEFSLTPTPAEPRTLGVERIKSLRERHPELEALLEQVAGKATESDAAEGVDHIAESTTIENDQEIENMDEQKTPSVDLNPVLEAIGGIGDAVKSLNDRLDTVEKNMPATKSAGHMVEVTKDEADKQAERPWKSFGAFLQAVSLHARTQGMKSDPRFKATGLSEGINSDGGFLVQTDFTSELLRRVYSTGVLASRARRVPISPNSNGLTINGLNETSRATGSRLGGITSYWLGEGGTKTASQPEFRQIELRLKKLIGLCYATDELLADAMALENIISQGFAEEFGWMVDNAMVRGTGAGQPLGVLNAAPLVSVTKEVGQAAATLVYDNVLKMWSRMWAPSRANAVWLINQDVEPQLWSMDLPVGTGGLPVMLPPGGASASPYMTLFGRPVIPVEQCSTLGTQGDIILADWSQYVMIEKGGIESASSIHVQFTTDETAYRFVLRTDGQPSWNAALTPANGTNTLSPFVTLDTRA